MSISGVSKLRKAITNFAWNNMPYRIIELLRYYKVDIFIRN